MAHRRLKSEGAAVAFQRNGIDVEREIDRLKN